MTAVHEEYNGAAQWYLGGLYSLFAKFQIFCGNFTLFLNFHAFSNGQKVRETRLATFSSITMCKSRFFPIKKKLIFCAKTRFCRNSDIFDMKSSLLESSGVGISEAIGNFFSNFLSNFLKIVTSKFS